MKDKIIELLGSAIGLVIFFGILVLVISFDGGSKEKSTDSVGSSPSFHGYTCTGDCSGHEAGYNWAAEKGITDPNDCGGKSTSFIEGCESYAQEQ